MKRSFGRLLEFIGGLGMSWLVVIMFFPYIVGTAEWLGFKALAVASVHLFENEKAFIIVSASCVLGGLLAWMAGRELQGEDW